MTEEAGLRPPRGTAPRVSIEVEDDAVVAAGAPLARLRDTPDVCFVAPMAARVARVSLLQGHLCPRSWFSGKLAAMPSFMTRQGPTPKRACDV